LGRALYKFGWRCDPSGDNAAWYTGVCEQVVRVCKNAPILFDIAQRSLELRAGCRSTPYRGDRGDWDREWDLLNADFSYPDYDEQTLLDTASAYTDGEKGYLLTVDQIKRTIAHVRAVERLPVVLDDEVISLMIWADDL
jgi:hypothetical protein